MKVFFSPLSNRRERNIDSRDWLDLITSGYLEVIFENDININGFGKPAAKVLKKLSTFLITDYYLCSACSEKWQLVAITEDQVTANLIRPTLFFIFMLTISL